jgi:hypothetical protein
MTDAKSERLVRPSHKDSAKPDATTGGEPAPRCKPIGWSLITIAVPGRRHRHGHRQALTD